MVSVGPFQQVPFDVLLHGVQKVLVVSDVNVEGCERLLALVSLKRQQEEDKTNGQHFRICMFLFEMLAVMRLRLIGGALVTYVGIPDRSSGRRRSLPAPC